MADHAIPIPLLWRIAFWLIVMGEGLTAAFFALGMVELLRARKFKARDFHRAKRLFLPGPLADSWSGSSGFSPLAASGLRCGNHRSGTVSSPRFASSRRFFSFSSSSPNRTLKLQRAE